MLRAACLLTLAVLAGAACADPTSGKVVLFPGELRASNYGGGRDVFDQYGGWNIPGWHFKPGGGWWSLTCRGARCQLAQLSLSVKPSTHPQYDGPALPSQLLTWAPLPKGRPADAPVGNHRVVIALFKAAALPALALREGPVTTWFHHHLPEPPTSIARQRIAMGPGQQAFLTQEMKPVRGPDGRKEEALHLGLEMGGARQPLGIWEPHMEDPGWISKNAFVMWAGDLDGDGKLDLLVNTRAYFWRTTLYLSTLAKPGQLVGEAGSFEFSPPDSAGC